MNLEIPAYADEEIKVSLREHLPRLQRVISKLLPALNDEEFTLFLSITSRKTNTPNTVLWFLSDNILVAVTDPFREDRSWIEYVRYKGRIDWLCLRAFDYDFEEVKPESELLLEFTTDDGFTDGLSASEKGCDHLQEIWTRYFTSNYRLDPPL